MGAGYNIRGSSITSSKGLTLSMVRVMSGRSSKEFSSFICTSETLSFLACSQHVQATLYIGVFLGLEKSRFCGFKFLC